MLWNDFKDLIKEYRLAKKEIFNKIKSYITEQLKKQKPNINIGFLEGIYVSVYREIIVSIKGEPNRYGYWADEIGGADIKKYKIIYCKRSNGNYFSDTCVMT